MKQKIKVMKNKPEVSDEEIRSYMNFDKILEARTQSMPFIGRTKLLVALTVVLVATAVWLYFESSEKKDVTDGNVSKVLSSNEQIAVSSDSVASLITDSSRKVPLKNNIPNSSRELLKAQKNKTEAIEPSTHSFDNEVEKTSGDSYQEAEPLNGYPNFYEYLNSNLKYPTESIKDSIQGIETIAFTIDKHGKPQNIRVRQSLGATFDNESLRVIQQMPAWKPAVMNGKPVASQISIPLTFHMEKLK